MRPFFKYFGGKWRLSGRCPAPKHDRIIEPFAGAAGYSVRYGEGMRVDLYDTSPRVVAIWDWLLGASVADVLALPVDPLHQRADVRTLGMPKGAEYLVQSWLTPQGRPSNRMPPSCAQFAIASPSSLWSSQSRARIASQLPGLRHWRIHEARYESTPDVVATWHIDPPYQYNAHSVVYGSTPLDYKALAVFSRTRRGLVMVHEQHGADWLPFETLNNAACGGNATNGVRCKQHEVWCIWDGDKDVPPVTRGDAVGG